jgi:hypothetical protein
MRLFRFVAGISALAIVGVILLSARPGPGRAQAPSRPEPPPDAPAPRMQWQYERVAPYGQRADGEAHKLMENEANSEREARRLVDEYAHTENDSQRSKIKNKLADVLDKQFDLQQKRRELEVAQIENQLKKLRELMRKRSEGRQTIVEKRLDQLLREAEGLGWTSPAGGGNLGNRQNSYFVPQPVYPPNPPGLQAK